jgi:ankyrin repeat protein
MKQSNACLLTLSLVCLIIAAPGMVGQIPMTNPVQSSKPLVVGTTVVSVPKAQTNSLPVTAPQASSSKAPVIPASASLFSALRNNDRAEVDRALKNGADINASDKDGSTALVIAANSIDPLRMYKVLLNPQYNANTGTTDANGNTPLMILLKKINEGDKAVELENWSAAAVALIDRDSVSIDNANNDGQTALHLAVSGQSWEWNGLGEKIMSKHPNVNVTDRDGDTPLIKAIKNNNIGPIPALLKDQSINLDAADKTGKTAVLLAQTAEALGHKHACSNVMVQLLINAGAKSPDLASQITQAASFKNGKKAVEEFVNQGVSVNSKDSDGNTPLIIAAQAGNEDVVRYLLSVRDQYHVLQAPRLFDASQLKSNFCYTYSALPFTEVDSIDPTIKNNAGNDAVTVAKGVTKNMIQSYLDSMTSA